MRLRTAGLSLRAIAAATGLSYGSVHRELSAVSNETPDARTVTGVDGKTYVATRLALASAIPGQMDVHDVTSAERIGSAGLAPPT